MASVGHVEDTKRNEATYHLQDVDSSNKEDRAATSASEPQKQRPTWFMLWFSIWVSLAAWIANFDTGFQGVVLIMPSYNKAFGSCQMMPDPTTNQMGEVCMLSATQQSITGVTTIFVAIGGALAGLTGHYLGRRGTIQCGCLLAVVGAAGMLGTAGSLLRYMVCKAIGGVGIGQLLASSLVYGTECVAASHRGLLLGLYNYGLSMGNVAASAVAAGSSTLAPTNNWQWKAPIICQIPLGVILGVGILMFPESPRWLLTKGREEEARQSFGKFYRKDPYAAEVTAQVRDVQKYIELEKAAGATTSWTEIYHRNDIRRTVVSAICLLGVALTGIQFVAPYTALFLSGLGIHNPYLLNVIIGLCIFAGALLGPLTLEYGGRRFCMLYGYSVMACCMLIVAGVGGGLGVANPVAQNLLVAFLCIWAFVFGGSAGPAAWLASAEMHSVRLRTYGQANTAFFYSIVGFASNFWTPYMLSKDYGNMGTNVGYFYFGLTVIWIALIFFFVPETARLTLEQIDDLFASGRMAYTTSTRRNRAIAGGDKPVVPSEAGGAIERFHKAET